MNGLRASFEKFNKTVKPIEAILSCLSCVEFLEDPPVTLICGHSICKPVSKVFQWGSSCACLLTTIPVQCFNRHSDPNSKDSLVFCEECKFETKNKHMRDSKFVQDLCKQFSGQRQACEQANKLLTA